MSLYKRPLCLVTALLLFFASTVVARNISEFSLTDCGIECYEASCNSTTNLGCVCTTEGFNAIADCLGYTCETASTYYTSYRVLYRDCDEPRPVWTVDPNYWAEATITFVIQTIAFGLRIATRVLGLGKWNWADTTCAMAYAILVGQFIMCILEGYYGYFVNYWTLDFAKLPYFWRIDFCRAVLYSIGLGLCKMSIIFLYQHIFAGSRLRNVLLATHLFNVLLILSYVISAFLVSRPLSCNWELNQSADCTYKDVWDGSGAYSAVNAALDVWLVVVPAVVVGRLQMKTEGKVNVIAVFATGVLTSLVAVMRFALYRLQGNLALSDAAHQHIIFATYYAYYVELTSCFVIACLPAIRQLVGTKIWPLLKTRVLSRVSSSWSLSWSWSWSRSRTRGSRRSGNGNGTANSNGKDNGRFSLTMPTSLATGFTGSTTITRVGGEGRQDERYFYNNFDDCYNHNNSRSSSKNNKNNNNNTDGAAKGAMMSTQVAKLAVSSPSLTPRERISEQHLTVATTTTTTTTRRSHWREDFSGTRYSLTETRCMSMNGRKSGDLEEV